MTLQCPDCKKVCMGLNHPHAPHYGTLPCGHQGVVNCKQFPVQVCGVCGRDDRPTKEPRHTYVPAQDFSS